MREKASVGIDEKVEVGVDVGDDADVERGVGVGIDVREVDVEI
jgi:tetrahydrodipicolinate N-succinyltransferase